jgi:hypothetical protein
MINYKGFKVISWVMHLLHRLAARCHGSAAVAETRAIQVKFSKQKVLDSSVGSSSRIICGTSGSNCASDDGTRHHITGCNCSGKVVLKPAKSKLSKQVIGGKFRNKNAHSGAKANRDASALQRRRRRRTGTMDDAGGG